MAYSLKFASKLDLDRDYVAMLLEGLWWSESMEAFTSAMVDTAIAKVRAKKTPARLDDARWGSLAEGLCVQNLHRGSFDGEAQSLEPMHEQFIPDNGLELTGRHHEIYCGDVRRVESAKLVTILRPPLRRLRTAEGGAVCSR